MNGDGLDREIRSLYTVVVRAEGADPSVIAYTTVRDCSTSSLLILRNISLIYVPSSLQVTLQIIDVNDETPEFQQDVYRFSIEENTPPSTIGIAEAIDRDEGKTVLHMMFQQSFTH